MQFDIPDYISNIYQKLQTAGHEVYFVGGCVRNLFLKREIKDWDMTTNATPEQILKVFPNGFYDNQFGTVGIPISSPVILVSEAHPESVPSSAQRDSGQSQNDKIVVEITTFRTEHGYSDKRRPDKVAWGKTIVEDLSRRDFTINAISMQYHPERSEGSRDSSPASWRAQNDNVIIIDPYDGKKDLEAKIIRAVGDPNQRFKEDALRLMRAIRIATELGFTIEENTWNAIVADANLLSHVSGERIKIELLRILASKHPYDGIMLLKNAGLLQVILPELMEGLGVSQVRPGRHHTTDVFTHNVMSLKFCPSTDPVVRFATLLHDVGKPKVKSEDEEGLVIFYNHEVVGARIAREIADRLHFSKRDREKIVTLIRWHMFSVNEDLSDAGIRRFIRRIGLDNVKDMMDLRVGDRLGGGTQTAESWRLKKFKQRVEEQLLPAPFSIKDLAINGNDVMKELGIKPGPKIGDILQKLFEEVDEDLSKNAKEYLLNRMKTISYTNNSINNK